MKTLMRIVSVLTLIAGVISLVAGGMNTGVFYAGFGETLAAIPGAVNIAISPSLQHVLGIVLPALYLICAIALRARKQEEEVK